MCAVERLLGPRRSRSSQSDAGGGAVFLQPRTTCCTPVAHDNAPFKLSCHPCLSHACAQSNHACPDFVALPPLAPSCRQRAWWGFCLTLTAMGLLTLHELAKVLKHFRPLHTASEQGYGSLYGGPRRISAWLYALLPIRDSTSGLFHEEASWGWAPVNTRRDCRNRRNFRDTSSVNYEPIMPLGIQYQTKKTSSLAQQPIPRYSMSSLTLDYAWRLFWPDNSMMRNDLLRPMILKDPLRDVLALASCFQAGHGWSKERLPFAEMVQA